MKKYKTSVIEWNIEEVENLRKKYSNIDNFETLEKENVLLVKLNDNKYHVQSINNGQLYANLLINENNLLYFKNKKKGKEIKKILEEKFNFDIELKHKLTFGIYEIAQTIRCIKTPSEIYVGPVGHLYNKK